MRRPVVGRSARVKSNASFRSFGSEKSQCSRPNLCFRTPLNHGKRKNCEKNHFSLFSQRGSKMRKFTFGCFSWKITFSLLIAFLVSKIAKRSEMSQIFLSCEANLHEKASSSFCLHRQSVKTWVGKSFSWQVGERKDRKTPLGRGYNLAITRVKSEKRDTWALTYPETNFV